FGLLLCTKPHDPLDTGPVVPAAVEDHDLPRRGQMRNIALSICDFSRSVGAGSATTRKMRGLTRSVIALIVPPLPAPSRPSNKMQIFRPACTTHCCSLTNSTCRRASSRSYSFRFSLPLGSGELFFPLGIGS